MTRLGVLVCGQPPAPVIAAHGPYLPWFEALFGPRGFALQSFDVTRGDWPTGPEAADAWLITGSPHGVYEAHGFLAPLEALIRRIVAQDRPLVGICFGHQIIAQALGGRVEKFAGGWSFGRRVYSVDGLGEVALNASHQDQVLEAPIGAEVIAQNAFTAIAGTRIGAQCITLQPHPEISAQIMASYVADFEGGRVVPQALVDAARTALDHPTDEQRVADWLAETLHGGKPPQDISGVIGLS